MQACIIDCNALGAWGQIASAFASLLTIWAALLISSSKNKVRGSGELGIFKVIVGGGPGVEVIQFTVTNYGERDFVVRFFGLRCKPRLLRWYVRVGIFVTLRGAQNTPLPSSVAPDGQALHADRDVDEVIETLVRSLAKVRLWPSLVLWAVRPCAFTPRKVIYLQYQPSLKKRLRDAIVSARRAAPKSEPPPAPPPR
jgi:hypothetical protein